MSKNSPYYGLNQFKLGFKPALFEYIGEFDLPIDKNKYNYQKNLISKKILKI